jgi:hypothetical protein
VTVTARTRDQDADDHVIAEALPTAHRSRPLAGAVATKRPAGTACGDLALVRAGSLRSAGVTHAVLVRLGSACGWSTWSEIKEVTTGTIGRRRSLDLVAALESVSEATARTTEAHSINAWLILAMSRCNVPGRRASDGACLYDEV